METTKHTPGPWVYDTYRAGDPSACRVRHAGLEIAAVYGDCPEEAEANARLIVQAVNSHADLERVATLLVEFADRNTRINLDGKLGAAVVAARAALAKAKAKGR